MDDNNNNADLIMALSHYLEALARLEGNKSPTYVNREIKSTIKQIEELKQDK